MGLTPAYDTPPKEVVLARTEKRLPLPGSISFGDDGIPIRPGVAPAPPETPLPPTSDAVVPLPP